MRRRLVTVSAAVLLGPGLWLGVRLAAATYGGALPPAREVIPL